jgi:hypothetical protein
MVNPWAFVPTATHPTTPFPYFDIPDNQNNWSDPLNSPGDGYLWRSRADVEYTPNGCADIGQNSPTPQALFGLHVIAQVTFGATTTYYDPSYGQTYANDVDMENKAVAGYFLVTAVIDHYAVDLLTGHIMPVFKDYAYNMCTLAQARALQIYIAFSSYTYGSP